MLRIEPRLKLRKRRRLALSDILLLLLRQRCLRLGVRLFCTIAISQFTVPRQEHRIILGHTRDACLQPCRRDRMRIRRTRSCSLRRSGSRVSFSLRRSFHHYRMWQQCNEPRRRRRRSLRWRGWYRMSCGYNYVGEHRSHDPIRSSDGRNAGIEPG